MRGGWDECLWPVLAICIWSFRRFQEFQWRGPKFTSCNSHDFPEPSTCQHFEGPFPVSPTLLGYVTAVTATVCPIKIEVRKQWRHVHVPQLYEQFWSEQNKVLGLGVWPSCLGAIHVGQDEAWETAQLKQPPPTGSLETTKRNPAPRDPTKLDNSELKSFKPIDWEFCLTALFWLIPSP